MIVIAFDLKVWENATIQKMAQEIYKNTGQRVHTMGSDAPGMTADLRFYQVPVVSK